MAMAFSKVSAGQHTRGRAARLSEEADVGARELSR
jgi:hypothetical protein